MRGDGAFEAVNGRGHAKHEEGIVEMRGLGIEVGESLGRLGDAASDEQLSENQRQAGFAGESGGGFGLRFSDDPALARHCALWQCRLCRSGPIFGAGRAHALYSSSSSCECVSSITMS